MAGPARACGVGKRNQMEGNTPVKLTTTEMEEVVGGGGGGGGGGYLWWAAASTAQVALGIKSFRRGHAGDSHFMPFKAFVVASLFVGATASAAVALLGSSGIHSVQDMKEVGATIRTGLRVPPRAQDK